MNKSCFFPFPHYRLMMIPRAMAMSSLTKSRMGSEVDFCFASFLPDFLPHLPLYPPLGCLPTESYYCDLRLSPDKGLIEGIGLYRHKPLPHILLEQG
jgi:hypothetical protein